MVLVVFVGCSSSFEVLLCCIQFMKQRTRRNQARQKAKAEVAQANKVNRNTPSKYYAIGATRIRTTTTIQHSIRKMLSDSML